MKKCNIAIDVDQVLAINFDRVVDALNEHFEVYLDPKLVDEYSLENCYTKHFPELNTKEIRAFLDNLWLDPDYFSKSAPLLPMLKIYPKLAGLSLDPQGPLIITSRPDGCKEMTKIWLDKHGISYKDIIHTDDKKSFCKKHKINYMIEDNPHQVREIASAGIGVFMLDYPYNRDIEAYGLNGIWRILNPMTIPAIIEQDLK
jgi:uncharacterized HAD superfamily protein